MATETEIVLAEMFTENTGRHFLDSGDAYGRNWERSQGKTVEDFLAAEPITADAKYGYIDVTLDAFHFLNNRLEFDDKMTAKFVRWSNKPENKDEGWYALMDEWANKKHNDPYDKVYSVNSYNYESLLSQTIQYVGFVHDCQNYVLLQIHGGADVRGGYTAPRVFRVLEEYALLEDQQYELSCPNRAPQEESLFPDIRPVRHDLSFSNGDWTDYEGSYISNPWQDFETEIYTDDAGDNHIRCPYCTEDSPMSVWSING